MSRLRQMRSSANPADGEPVVFEIRFITRSPKYARRSEGDPTACVPCPAGHLRRSQRRGPGRGRGTDRAVAGRRSGRGLSTVLVERRARKAGVTFVYETEVIAVEQDAQGVRARRP